MSSGGQLWPDGPVMLPARIRLGDETYTVKAMGTFEVLHLLARGHWSALVPSGLRYRDRTRIVRRLYDPGDGLDFVHLWSAACQLGGRLAGTLPGEGHAPESGWWPATRIASMVVEHWLTFDGWCVRRGFDPHTAPPHRVVAAGWQFWIDFRPTDTGKSDGKQVSVEALRDQVWTPPAQHRAQVMKFTANQERAAALAALREALPG